MRGQNFNIRARIFTSMQSFRRHKAEICTSLAQQSTCPQPINKLRDRAETGQETEQRNHERRLYLQSQTDQFKAVEHANIFCY